MGKGLHRRERKDKATDIAFAMPVAVDAAAHEREAARELRASQGWKNQIAAGKCHYCGGTFKPSELTMDHVIPVARGGKSDRHNVVPCCKACNNAKKARMAVEDILDSLP
jgi:5-methylcytosine-specific restriction endonuclease McrA